MAKKKDLTFHLINYNSSIKLARIWSCCAWESNGNSDHQDTILCLDVHVLPSFFELATGGAQPLEDKRKKKTAEMEVRGIEPRASRMRSERSTIWATPPLLVVLVTFSIQMVATDRA